MAADEWAALKAPAYDREAYKERKKVERPTRRLKRIRQVATQHEKRGSASLAMVHIACVASIIL